jgi:hypothetical protein
MVGLTARLQQTPLSVNSEPPLEVMFPPPSAVEGEDGLIADVVTVGFEAITTVRVLDVPEPQTLVAFTEIVPPLAPGVAEMDVEVELPLHPEGRDQVYDAAPVTSEILYV